MTLIALFSQSYASLVSFVSLLWFSLASQYRQTKVQMLTQGFKPALRSATANERGQIGIGSIIGLVIVLLVFAQLFPVGLESIIDVDTSSWPTAVANLWDALPIILVALAVWLIWQRTRGSNDG